MSAWDVIVAWFMWNIGAPVLFVLVVFLLILVFQVVGELRRKKTRSTDG